MAILCAFTCMVQLVTPDFSNLTADDGAEKQFLCLASRVQAKKAEKCSLFLVKIAIFVLCL